jgi:hypothetical protein
LFLIYDFYSDVLCSVQVDLVVPRDSLSKIRDSIFNSVMELYSAYKNAHLSTAPASAELDKAYLQKQSAAKVTVAADVGQVQFKITAATFQDTDTDIAVDLSLLCVGERSQSHSQCKSESESELSGNSAKISELTEATGTDTQTESEIQAHAVQSSNCTLGGLTVGVSNELANHSAVVKTAFTASSLSHLRVLIATIAPEAIFASVVSVIDKEEVR